MIPTVKIIDTNNKWTIVRYIHAETNSKIQTQDLEDDFNNGIIDIQNPELLNKAKKEMNE